MRYLKMSTLFLLMLLTTVRKSDAQVSFDLRIGPPPPPRVLRVQPHRPGPGFVWIDGYWFPSGNRYQWHNGYWTRPTYDGARWVAPRHDGTRYLEGYWEGGRGRFDHDHRWDRQRERDFRRERR
jgi:hypothetical protein